MGFAMEENGIIGASEVDSGRIKKYVGHWECRHYGERGDLTEAITDKESVGWDAARAALRAHVRQAHAQGV
jgi:hypothetical protein